MGFLGRLRRALDIAGTLNEEMGKTSRVADDLSRANPLGGLAGGGGQLGPQFQASSVAPVTPGGAAPGGGGLPNLAGASLRIGGGGEGAGDGGDKVAGIESVETNRDKIGAIVEAAGVAPPAREAWDENGVGPGEFPGLIIRTVLALGTSAPTPYLVWCAGWLVYSSSATTARVTSTPSRKGPLGPSGQTRAEALRAYLDANFPTWGGAEAPPGFTTSGGGGGEAWANGLPGGGSWTGESAFDTLTASTSKAVASGVVEANKPMVDGINKVVDQMSKLNATLSTAAGGVGVRAGR